MLASNSLYQNYKHFLEQNRTVSTTNTLYLSRSRDLSFPVDNLLILGWMSYLRPIFSTWWDHCLFITIGSYALSKARALHVNNGKIFTVCNIYIHSLTYFCFKRVHSYNHLSKNNNRTHFQPDFLLTINSFSKYQILLHVSSPIF